MKWAKMLLLLSLLILSSEKKGSRTIASVDLNCLELMSSLLVDNQSTSFTKALFKLKTFKSAESFNEISYSDYLEILKREGGQSVSDLPDSAEAAQAFVDYYAELLKRDTVTFDSKVKTKIVKIVDEMKKRKKWDFHNVESIVDDFIEIKYPGTSILKHSTVEQHLKAQIHRELVKDGLQKMFVRYHPDKVPAFIRFSHTKMGEALKTVFFNLPILSGMPPLYLPKGRIYNLPKEMIDEILEKGLTKEVEEKIFKLYYGSNSNVKASFLNDYEWLRKRYTAAIGVYLTFMFIHDFYVEQKEISKEAEELDQIQKESQELFGMIGDLEKAGIDVFDEKQDLNELTTDRICQLVDNCIMNHLGHKDLKKASKELINSCVKFMDPSGKCQRY